MSFELVAALACGPVDRLRGSARGLPSKTLELALYGLLIGIAMGLLPSPWLYAVAALFALGGAPGWGEPLGAALEKRPMLGQRLEWWQVGPLQTDVRLAIVARGALWGVPCLLVAPWAPHAVLLVPIMAFAMLAAVYIGLAFEEFLEWNAWHVMEVSRGLIAGILVLGGATWL